MSPFVHIQSPSVESQWTSVKRGQRTQSPHCDLKDSIKLCAEYYPKLTHIYLHEKLLFSGLCVQQNSVNVAAKPVRPAPCVTQSLSLAY